MFELPSFSVFTLKIAAKEDNSIGYLPRGMVQASMPYRDPKTSMYCRKNGNLTLTMTAIASGIGLPFGSIPRLILAWIGREVLITNKREIIFGDNLSDFMCDLGLLRIGGPRGDITRLKDQIIRLFSAAVSICYADRTETRYKNLLVADEYCLWSNFRDNSSENRWHSSVILSQPFFEELTGSPVPLDLRVFRALKSSPMAIDIYSWLTHRYFRLKNSPKISWQQLQMQFGADYARTRDFKYGFIDALKKVSVVYPTAKFNVSDTGLQLFPSPTHISKQQKNEKTVENSGYSR